MNLKKKPQNGKMKENTGFKDLLNSVMTRRWYITAMVLGGFMLIIAGIFSAVMNGTAASGEWKEILLLMLGAFIGSYGKIIDYWFSDADKDKMLVQKMDEEDGISLSNTKDMKPATIEPLEDTTNVKNKVEIDEDGDGKMDGYDLDGDGKIDEYFDHRNCAHVWGDADGDGEEECLVCGLIK